MITFMYMKILVVLSLLKGYNMGFGGGAPSKPDPAPLPPPAPVKVEPETSKGKEDVRGLQRRAKGRAKSVQSDFIKLLEEEAPVKRNVLSDKLG